MPATDPLAEFPAEFPASATNPGVVYRRIPDLFAVHGPVPDALRESVMLELEEGVAVCRGSPDPAQFRLDQVVVTPVYTLVPSGGVAIPTGRAFVRFAEEVRAEERAADLRRAGYVVSSIPPYAPHAAWVEVVEGGAAAGLKGLARLGAMGGVAQVEPEMLRERRGRDHW